MGIRLSITSYATTFYSDVVPETPETERRLRECGQRAADNLQCDVYLEDECHTILAVMSPTPFEDDISEEQMLDQEQPD